MRNAIFTALLLAALGAPAESLAQDRCEALFRETCRASPEQLTKDATGTVLGFDGDREYRRLFEGNAGRFSAKGLALARASATDGSFRSVIEALGLKNAPVCRVRTQHANCVALAGETLGQLLMVDLSNKRAGHVEITTVPLERLLALVQSPRYQQAEAELSKELAAASSPEFATKAASLVIDLRAEVVTAARRFLPATLETEKLLEKVAKVEYADDQCPPLIFGSKLSAIAGIGAYYDDELNKVRICRGLASSVSSLYALSSILAHEITHSIDPCTLRGARTPSAQMPAAPVATLEEYDAGSPWGALATCLRDSKAMGSKFLASEYSAARCRQDQLVEAIPDFVAAEVVGSLLKKGKLPAQSPEEAMRGLTNAWRIGCAAPDVGGDDPHGTLENRIERTLALQPDIRKALACGPIPSDVRYCGNVARAQDSAPAPSAPSTPRRAISSIEAQDRVSRRALVVHAQLGDARTEIKLREPARESSRESLAAKDFNYLYALAKALPASRGHAPASCGRGSMTVELEPADGMSRSACLFKNSSAEKAYQKLAEALRWQQLR